MSPEKMGKVNRNKGPYQGRHAAQSPLPEGLSDVSVTASPAGKSLAAQSLQDLEHAAIVGESIYYKITPDEGVKMWHCFAYWRRGDHAGYYVYAAALAGDLASALTHLARKVREVESGVRQPTKDLRKGPR